MEELTLWGPLLRTLICPSGACSGRRLDREVGHAGLLGASIWCWAIIVDKTITYRRTNSEMNKFERTFWSGQSLEELYSSRQKSRRAGWARCSSRP